MYNHLYCVYISNHSFFLFSEENMITDKRLIRILLAAIIVLSLKMIVYNSLYSSPLDLIR